MRKIFFSNFWVGFESEAFFRPLVEEALGLEVRPGSRQDADIHLTSVFPPRRLSLAGATRMLPQNIGLPIRKKHETKQKKIWFTGENVRPPASGYDLTLSFDLDSFTGTNFYLPLIVTALDWFGTHLQSPDDQVRRLGRTVTPREAFHARQTDVAERPKFACAFVGNPDPVRMRAIESLRTIGTVDVYGSAVGRAVEDKISIASDYRFMVCFENDLYPGYVTEKALDAWASGCIPLWWGIDKAELLNRKALINLFDLDGLNDFVQTVKSLEGDRHRMVEMGSQPLFRKVLSLERLKGNLRSVLSN